MEAVFPKLQTLYIFYNQAAEYWAYSLANLSELYNGTANRKVSKTFKFDKLQIKVYIFNSRHNYWSIAPIVKLQIILHFHYTSNLIFTKELFGIITLKTILSLSMKKQIFLFFLVRSNLAPILKFQFQLCPPFLQHLD